MIEIRQQISLIIVNLKPTTRLHYFPIAVFVAYCGHDKSSRFMILKLEILYPFIIKHFEYVKVALVLDGFALEARCAPCYRMFMEQKQIFRDRVNNVHSRFCADCVLRGCDKTLGKVCFLYGTQKSSRQNP
jgi:hypothetical protein